MQAISLGIFLGPGDSVSHLGPRDPLTPEPLTLCGLYLRPMELVGNQRQQQTAACRTCAKIEERKAAR